MDSGIEFINCTDVQIIGGKISGLAVGVDLVDCKNVAVLDSHFSTITAVRGDRVKGLTARNVIHCGGVAAGISSLAASIRRANYGYV